VKFGERFPLTNYYFSTVKIDDSATFVINGEFVFYTGVFIAVNKNARL
jgi:hypothetical protein